MWKFLLRLLGIRKRRRLEVVPLELAVLCVGCHCITATRNEHCPVCGETGLVLLAQALGTERTEALLIDANKELEVLYGNTRTYAR